MKRAWWLIGAVSTVGLAFALVQVPALIQGSNKRLQDAQTLEVKALVTPVNGPAFEITAKYAKPNFLRIETPQGFVVSDGKRALEYTKATHSYVEKTLGPDGNAPYYTKPEVYGWLAFFDKNAFQKVEQAQRGRTRTIRGFSVTEIALAQSMSADREISLLWDDKLGLQRGFTYRSTDKNQVTMATELTLGNKAAAPADFALVAPSGATKAPDAPAAPSWAQVSAIFNRTRMPCHNSTNRTDGLDLTTQPAILAARGAVNLRQPERSTILRSIKGEMKLMPLNGPALPKADIDTIEAWIRGGAKG